MILAGPPLGLQPVHIVGRHCTACRTSSARMLFRNEDAEAAAEAAAQRDAVLRQQAMAAQAMWVDGSYGSEEADAAASAGNVEAPTSGREAISAINFRRQEQTAREQP